MLEDEDPRVSHVTRCVFCVSDVGLTSCLTGFLSLPSTFGLIVTPAGAGKVLMPSQELV